MSHFNFLRWSKFSIALITLSESLKDFSLFLGVILSHKMCECKLFLFLTQSTFLANPLWSWHHTVIQTSVSHIWDDNQSECYLPTLRKFFSLFSYNNMIIWIVSLFKQNSRRIDLLWNSLWDLNVSTLRIY